MEIAVRHGDIQDEPADAIVVGVYEGSELGGAAKLVDATLNGAIAQLLQGGDLNGKEGEIAVLYPMGALPAKRVLIVGMGKPEKLDLDGIRKAAGTAAAKARDLGAKRVATAVLGEGAEGVQLAGRAQAVVEGATLALYRYPAERQEPPKDEKEIESFALLVEQPELQPAVEAGAELGERIALAVNLTRTLVNHPSNIATPTFLGESAQAIAQEQGLKCHVYDREWAAEQGMGAFLSVAQGAGQPPRFIVLEYEPSVENAPTLVLVGKGITFDSGGISLKPGERMWEMKDDMGGGGAVLGAMKAIGAIKPPVRVIGLVPATDNMPDANAYKPGDVVRAMNGKTIEIRSTDAEGRMLLADALCYAARFNPAAVIDLATLTGACVVALGQGMAAGCFSNDDSLRDRVMAASQAAAERLWPMPLFEEYTQALKSDYADLVHTAGRVGGVGTSAAFLQAFTDYPWVHLDIAGMVLSPEKHQNAYTPKGATGFGVRLLVELMMRWQGGS
jgi:leucyl aminopeptidase